MLLSHYKSILKYTSMKNTKIFKIVGYFPCQNWIVSWELKSTSYDNLCLIIFGWIKIRNECVGRIWFYYYLGGRIGCSIIICVHLKFMTHKMWSTVSPPGFSGFGFFREIVRTKINKTQKNQVNIKGIKYFCSHKQVLILLPHNLRQIPFLTLLLPECATLMEWVGMCTPPGRYHYQTCIQ